MWQASNAFLPSRRKYVQRRVRYLQSSWIGEGRVQEAANAGRRYRAPASRRAAPTHLGKYHSCTVMMIGIILSLSLYHLSIIQLLASIIYRVSQKHLLQNLDHLLAVFRPSLTHPLPFQTIKTGPAPFFNCLIQSKDLGGQFGGPQIHCIACRAPVTTRGF